MPRQDPDQKPCKALPPLQTMLVWALTGDLWFGRRELLKKGGDFLGSESLTLHELSLPLRT